MCVSHWCRQELREKGSILSGGTVYEKVESHCEKLWMFPLITKGRRRLKVFSEGMTEDGADVTNVWYKSIDQACTFRITILSLSLSNTYNQSPWLPYITLRPAHTIQNKTKTSITRRLFTKPPKCHLQIPKPPSPSSLSCYSLSCSLRCPPTLKTQLQIPTSAECDVMQVLMPALTKWVSQFLVYHPRYPIPTLTTIPSNTTTWLSYHTIPVDR